MWNIGYFLTRCVYNNQAKYLEPSAEAVPCWYPAPAVGGSTGRPAAALPGPGHPRGLRELGPGPGPGCASPRRGEVAAKALGRTGRGQRGVAGPRPGRGGTSPNPGSWSRGASHQRNPRAEAKPFPRS